MRLLPCLALVAVLSGCATGFKPQPGPGPEPVPAEAYVMLTRPITVLGDTQEHLATGFPLHDNDSAIDGYAEVTQRPPELPLFARRLMEHALQAHPDEPWLHLGDLLDLSCRIEAERVRDVVRTAGRAGAILPGNHDGLMFGIYNYPLVDLALDPGARKWNQACRRGAAAEDPTHRSANEAFTKRDFINMYLGEYAKLPALAPGLRAPEATGEQRLSWASPDPGGFVTGIEARLLDGADYASSFIAQRMRLPPAPGSTRGVVLIGIDTNQAGPLVSAWDTIMGRSPGSVGHVLPEQVLAIAPWVREAVERGDLVILAGHHNWVSLGLPSRTLLASLLQSLPHPAVYLSAHTHRGFWAVHSLGHERPVLELNVSSLSDWPIAYRRLSIGYDERSNRILVRGDIMPRGTRPVASDADLVAAWEQQTCAVSGLPVEYLRALDLAAVAQQRANRRSLWDWLRQQFDPDCEACEASMFASAGSYQDQLLSTLVQVRLHLGPRAPELGTAELPAWCGGGTFFECASRLMAEQPADLAGQRRLFRRKAQLVHVVNNQLDRITEPLSKAYMTCRAVQAAKADFDATPEGWNDARSEKNRRAEQFFRIEASVGMR